MNDLLSGYRFKDLLESRIVSSRSDLHRKQRALGFPLPIKTGERSAWWPASEVHAWIKFRAALREKPKPLPRAIAASRKAQRAKAAKRKAKSA